MSVQKFSILMSFILQRQKTVQKLFLRKAGVSWKPTGENPAGLIHVHCISKENQNSDLDLFKENQNSDLDLLFWYINPLKIYFWYR